MVNKLNKFKSLLILFLLLSINNLIGSTSTNVSFTYSSTIDPSITNLYGEITYPTSLSGPFPMLYYGHGYTAGEDKTQAGVSTLPTDFREKLSTNGPFVVIALGLRQRDNADGRQDDGGRETYDIKDGIDYVRTNFPTIASGYLVIAGGSGGGGNAYNYMMKFPDAYNYAVVYFGISDYGFETNQATYGAFVSWWDQQHFADLVDSSFGVRGVLARNTMYPLTSGGGFSGNPYDNAQKYWLYNYRSRSAVDILPHNIRTNTHLWFYHNTADTTVYPDSSYALTNSLSLAGLGSFYTFSNSATLYPHSTIHVLPDSYNQWSYHATNFVYLSKTLPRAGSRRIGGWLESTLFNIWLGYGTNGVADVTYDTVAGTYAFTLQSGSTAASITQASYTTNFTLSGNQTITVPVIAAPTNLRTSPSDFGDQSGYIEIQLNWNSTAVGETAQVVEVSTNSVDYYTAATLAAGQNKIDTLRVPWNTRRWYRVRSYVGTSYSLPSDPVSVVGAMPVSHQTITSSATNIVTILWVSVGSTGVTGYRVYQDTSTNFNTANLTNYWADNIDVAGIIITNNFALNTTYYWRVVSVCPAGESEIMDKPRAYLSGAPNGVPTVPVLAIPWTLPTSTNNETSTSIKFAFTETAFNLYNELVEISTDSNVWVKVPFTRVDQAGQAAQINNLLPGTLYYLRVSSTNALGSSDYAQDQIRMPAVASSGITTWYIGTTTNGGNNSGTSWANAFQGIRSINWFRMGPGHTINIDGGTTSANYTDVLEVSVDGDTNNPIIIKMGRDAGHNGHVYQHGEIVVRSRWLTIDGSLSDTFNNIPISLMTNNIGWTITGFGDLGSFDAAFNATVMIGNTNKFLEITGVGNPNSSDSVFAYGLEPSTFGPYNCKNSYIWIHDNDSRGLETTPATGYYNQQWNVIDHCMILRNGNNALTHSGSIIISNCWIGEFKNPGIAHPDGIEGKVNDFTLINSRIGNSAGGTMYMTWACTFPGSLVTNGPIVTQTNYGFGTNVLIANNYFYKTRDVDQGGLAFSAQVNDPISSTNITATSTNVYISYMMESNWVFNGNTVFSSLPYDLAVGNPSTSRGTTAVRALHAENNLIYTSASGSSGGSAFGWGGDDAPTDQMIVNYNIIAGRQKVVGFGATFYNTAEDMNAALPYKNNSSSVPQLNTNGTGDLVLYGLDTVARNTATNLSSQFSLLNNDINGFARGADGSWDIGAFEYDYSKVVWIDFERTFTNGISTNWYFMDESGNSHHPLRWGNPDTKTNYPSIGSDQNGGQAAFFQEYPNENINVGGNTTQYHTGDYMGITNLVGIKRLTNVTICVWVKWYDPNQDDQAIIGSGGANDDGLWILQRLGGITRFGLGHGGSLDQEHFLFFPDSGVSNSWHHYAITWNGTNHTGIAYYDGVPYVTNSTVTSITELVIDAQNSASTFLGFGCWTFENDPWRKQISEGGNDDTPDNGWLNRVLVNDEIIYNRVLSSGEIFAVVNGGESGVASSASSSPSTTSTITIQSSIPANGVSIIATTDNNSDSSGSTSFVRVYNLNTTVTLTAPYTISGYIFKKWQKDGIDFSTNPSTTFTADTDHTFTVIYQVINTYIPFRLYISN